VPRTPSQFILRAKQLQRKAGLPGDLPGGRPAVRWPSTHERRKGGGVIACSRGYETETSRPDPLPRRAGRGAAPPALDQPPPVRRLEQMPGRRLTPGPRASPGQPRVGRHCLASGGAWAKCCVWAIHRCAAHVPLARPWGQPPLEGEEPVGPQRKVIRGWAALPGLGISCWWIQTRAQFIRQRHGKDLAEAGRRQVRASCPKQRPAIAAIACDALMAPFEAGGA